MEIKVEKDLKTGESTVLSSIPLPSEDFKGTGIKVYDDGQKSVYAVSSNHSPSSFNGSDGLAPVEVEDLLRQASEKNSKSPTEYHEPVYANPFCRPTTPQREKATPEPNFQERVKVKANGLGSEGVAAVRPTDNGLSEERGDSFSPVGPVRPGPQPRCMTPQAAEAARTLREKPLRPGETSNGTQDPHAPAPQAGRGPSDALAGRPGGRGARPAVQAAEEDVRYHVVHSLPPGVDDREPVTMIFMGYQRADDDDDDGGKTLLTGYDGVIHAELVVIDDEDGGEGASEKPSYHPAAPPSQPYQPARPTPLPRKRAEVRPHEHANHAPPHGSSPALREPAARRGSPARHVPLGAPTAADGAEDPSLAGNRPARARRCCSVM